jgi:hypothetical protein
MTAWLDSLEADVRRRASDHPIWKQIVSTMDAGLKREAEDRFRAEFRNFELAETVELDTVARAVPDYLTRNPSFLTAARVGIASLDLAAIAAVIWATVGPYWAWYHLLLIPLAASVTRQGVELIVMQAVDAGKNQIREHRETLLTEKLSGPIATWLTDRPLAAVTSLSRLREVMTRVPASTRELANRVLSRGLPKAS